ncbi:hypothetical protein B0O80DRAFT_436406 [Mortierella sp. GBAus27b]|nr:hypothetical protein B0O80DRAFT_436406 [Mortierella sp. GBAus27b]
MVGVMVMMMGTSKRRRPSLCQSLWCLCRDLLGAVVMCLSNTKPCWESFLGQFCQLNIRPCYIQRCSWTLSCRTRTLSTTTATHLGGASEPGKRVLRVCVLQQPPVTIVHGATLVQKDRLVRKTVAQREEGSEGKERLVMLRV